MKILVAGGGPAGLSAAALLAQTSSTHQITVIERQGSGDSRGWGITLRRHALGFLNLAQLLPPNQLRSLAGRRLLVRGECRIDYDNPPDDSLVTIARDDLVAALARRCEQLGVQLRLGVDADQLRADEIKANDLLVAADGAHSPVRQRWAKEVAPNVGAGRNWYAWLATDRMFPKLTILFTDRIRPLLAWAYEYAPGMSSFIVERHDDSPAHAHELLLPVSLQRQDLAGEFAAELQGHRLFCAQSVRWKRFPLVRCKHLQVDNIVLVGDAAHTTHFSQGFGTMFAFDDACALAEALQGATSVRAALERYQGSQQPRIEEFQAAADKSRRWSEQLLAAAQARREDQVQALIAARWPRNDAPAAPAPKERLQRMQQVAA